MRVFVTGGTGFIGSHLVKQLHESGHEVTVVSRQPASFPWPIRIEIGEYWTPDALKLIKGHDAVIHCALVWGIEEEERQFRDVSCTTALLQSAIEAGVPRFIYTSSVAIHRPFAGLMDESSPMSPTDDYGITKARTEDALAAETSISVAIVRPGPTVGPPAFAGAAHKSDTRFSDYIHAARADADIRVDRLARQFSGVADLARVYIALLENPDLAGPFIAVSEELTSWASIARQIAYKLGSKSLIDGEPTEDTPRFEVGKMRNLLGLRFDASASIEAHIDYLLARL